MFRRCLKLSVLTERRVYHPYGLNGNVTSIIVLAVFVCQLFNVICFTRRGHGL